MKLILQDKNTYVLRANVGEEIIAELGEFCKKEGIDAGKFFAIGAAKEVKLGWYDVDAKEYTWKEYKEKLEIVSLLGNIARKPFDSTQGQEIIAHAHGSFSNQQMQVVGGHVARLVVGAACEIVLERFDGRIDKPTTPKPASISCNKTRHPQRRFGEHEIKLPGAHSSPRLKFFVSAFLEAESCIVAT